MAKSSIHIVKWPAWAGREKRIMSRPQAGRPREIKILSRQLAAGPAKKPCRVSWPPAASRL